MGADAPVSGRRASDDGARLLIAEDAIKRVESQYSTIAEGQAAVSAVLIGALHKDGTATPGLVQQVKEIRSKQDETDEKLAAVLSDMGDLKSAQADQAHTLTSHTNSLIQIEALMKRVADAGIAAVKWVAGGVVGAIGIGALHLVTLWWPTIVAFFASWLPAADAASKSHP